MIEIKSAELTLKPNYIQLPVTTTASIDEFNEVYLYWKNKEDKGEINWGIPRTKSGGISIKNLRLPRYEVKTDKNLGAELIVLALDNDKPAFYRLQYRASAKDNSISGRQAYQLFSKELAKDGINIEDYFIDNGEEVKKTIPKAKIQLLRDSYKDIIFENANHIDIHNSYPSGMAEFIPEWRPAIERLYYGRKEHPENKAILNLTCGYFQSLKDNRIKAKLAHISRYAIARNNQKIDAMVEWLKANDRIPVLINTDGIWFIGAPTNLSSKLLGEFEEDHKNCTLRIKSSGAYEYIEDGKYHPVLRGRTKLDRIKPRDMWQWGDIYQEDAQPIMLTFNKNKGIVEVEDEKEKLG